MKIETDSETEKKLIKLSDRVKDAQANYDRTLATIETILSKERGYISKVPVYENNEDVVVMCSGGLDSSVMLDLLIEEWNVRINPLFFKRGSRNEKYEEEAFDFFIDYYKEKYPKNIGEVAKLSYEIPPKQLKENFPKEYVLSIGHPLRNSTMQNLAVMYAVTLSEKLGHNVRTIFTGSIGEDRKEPELGILSLRSQTLMTCISMADWEWQITSPLTDWELREKPIYKLDLIERAVAKNIPLDKTRTCFSSEEIADGTCYACKLRLEAFNYLGIKDPVKYKNYPI